MQGLSRIASLAKRIGAVKLGAVGAAVCAAALIITFAVKGSGNDDQSVQAQSENSSVSTTEKSTQPQDFSVVNFKKAPLSEYNMDTQQTQASTSEQKPAETTPEDKNDSSAFKIQPQNTSFKYSDNMNSPARFYSTRDTSSEYFTVRDITTGKIVTMNAYELVCSIVYNEVGDGWGAEAIKAQAVAAYSCLRYCDSIGTIETVGIKKNYTPTIERCVRSVEGQVVTYNGNIANTLYSASTAGYTIPSGDVIISKYPYLTCVKSAYDDKDPNWGRKASFTREQVKAALEKQFKIKLSDDEKNWFKITDSRYAKYIFGMSIDSKAKTTGKTIANLFKLRSNAFEISYSGGKFTFTTYGWGHGVGMSQWGACMYARHGYKYDQILTHYYAGTKISLSKISQKAVERGKKSEEELKREAQTATQTTTAGDQVIPETSSSSKTSETDKQTAASRSASETTTKSSKGSEEQSSQTAEKVTKSAENAE